MDLDSVLFGLMPFVVVPMGTTTSLHGTLWYHDCQGGNSWLQNQSLIVARKAAMKVQCASESLMPLLRHSWRVATQRPACSRSLRARAFPSGSFTRWLATSRRC